MDNDPLADTLTRETLLQGVAPYRTPIQRETVKALAARGGSGHAHTPFCGDFLALTVAFWHQPHHWAALDGGMAPEEAAALEEEFALVLAGERNVLGQPCLCDRMGDSRLHAVGGFRGYGDSAADIAGLRVDLQRAATALPISWHGTRRVYILQGREAEYGERFLRWRTGRSDRPQDAEPDPCPATDRHRCTWLAYGRMAFTLGAPAPRCRWPRRQDKHADRAA